MTLWLTDRLPFLWQWLGINYPQLRAILSVKLTLDNRRTIMAFNRTKVEDTNAQNGYWKALGFYAFIGLFASVTLVFAPRETLLIPLALFFGYVMAVCAMILITDFSSVVLDATDNQILLFRPVDSRTLLIARIVHVASYLLTFALAVGLFGILTIGIRFGIGAGLAALGLVLLAAVLMLFLTNVFYLLLMRFMSEERLRETINYFQIILGVAFYGGLQLMPRLMAPDDPLHPDPFNWQWWHLLLPPFWSAGSLDLVLNGHATLPNWLGLGLTLLLPFAGLWLMSRVLAPVFGQRLAGLDAAEKQFAPLPTSSVQAPGTANQTLADRLAGWLTSSPLERSTFTMIWHLTGRDRKFKLKTYPSLAFGIIYVVLMNSRSMGNAPLSHLVVLYISSVYVFGAILQITVSDNYKAAWIYEAAPISRPGELLSGGLKAVITKLMIPYFTLLAAYVLYLKGIAVLPDVLLALSGSLVMVLTAALFSNRSLPFSMPQDMLRQNNSSRSLLSVVIIGLIAAAHWGLTYVPYGVWAAIPVMLGIAGLLFRSYRQTGWQQIVVA